MLIRADVMQILGVGPDFLKSLVRLGHLPFERFDSEEEAAEADPTSRRLGYTAMRVLSLMLHQKLALLGVSQSLVSVILRQAEEPLHAAEGRIIASGLAIARGEPGEHIHMRASWPYGLQPGRPGSPAVAIGTRAALAARPGKRADSVAITMNLSEAGFQLWLRASQAGVPLGWERPAEG